MTINVTKTLNFLRQVSAYLGVIITTTNAVHLPAGVRETLLGASSLILAIEHLNVKTAATTDGSSSQSPVA
jgi:hypothetical protein